MQGNLDQEKVPLGYAVDEFYWLCTPSGHKFRDRKSAHNILIFFLGFLIFWDTPSKQTATQQHIYQNFVYSHPDVENHRATAVPELTQTINQYIAMRKRCPVT